MSVSACTWFVVWVSWDARRITYTMDSLYFSPAMSFSHVKFDLHQNNTCLSNYLWNPGTSGSDERIENRQWHRPSSPCKAITKKLNKAKSLRTKKDIIFLSLNEICEFFSRQQNMYSIVTSDDDSSRSKTIMLVWWNTKHWWFCFFPCILYVGVARFWEVVLD